MSSINHYDHPALYASYESTDATTQSSTNHSTLWKPMGQYAQQVSREQGVESMNYLSSFSASSNEGAVFIMAVALTLALVTIVFQHFNYMRRFAELKQVVKQAENKALGAQLTPHFLYNVLNTVTGSIVRGNIDESLSVMGHFSHLMRQVFRNSRKHLIPIQDELQAVVSYVDLELTRLENAFTCEINCPDEAKGLYIPSLFIQPLVENSIWHGIATQGQWSKILIDIALVEKQVVISICNNGNPIKEDTTIKVHLNKASALSVLRERVNALKPIYGPSTSLKIVPNNCGEYCTSAILTFPQIRNPLACLN